jgi:hypothetical protein
LDVLGDGDGKLQRELDHMNEHQKVTTFLRHVFLYDGSDERCKPQKPMAQIQPHKRFVQRFASVMALFIVLALVGVGGMVAFAGLLMGYPGKVKRLLDARRLVRRRQESHRGKPDITTLPGSYRRPDDHGSVQGAAEVSGQPGSLGSPSWLSNRLCG